MLLNMFIALSDTHGTKFKIGSVGAKEGVRLTEGARIRWRWNRYLFDAFMSKRRRFVVVVD
jgi:hypothetical protein